MSVPDANGFFTQLRRALLRDTPAFTGVAPPGGSRDRPPRRRERRPRRGELCLPVTGAALTLTALGGAVETGVCGLAAARGAWWPWHLGDALFALILDLALLAGAFTRWRHRGWLLLRRQILREVDALPADGRMLREAADEVALHVIHASRGRVVTRIPLAELDDADRRTRLWGQESATARRQVFLLPSLFGIVLSRTEQVVLAAGDDDTLTHVEQREAAGPHARGAGAVVPTSGELAGLLLQLRRAGAAGR